MGLAPTLGAIVPFVAVQNTAIDIGRTHPLLAPDSEPSYGRIVCVGAAAGLAAQTATYPLDVPPPASESSHRRVASEIDASRRRRDRDAVRPPYGVAATATRFVRGRVAATPGPRRFVHSTATPRPRRASSADGSRRRRDRGALRPRKKKPAAAQVLRRRLQAEGGAVGDVGWVAALRSIVRREGVGSLFAGIVPTYLKAVPTVQCRA